MHVQYAQQISVWSVLHAKKSSQAWPTASYGREINVWYVSKVGDYFRTNVFLSLNAKLINFSMIDFNATNYQWGV